jgi:Cu(I)/Ag(I) efflux system membrane fusion protein
LSTLDVVDAAKRRGADLELSPAKDSAQFAERRLQGLGMSNAQIEEIRRTRQSPLDIKLTAPADGFVIARNVVAGQKFERGVEWYRIANLDRVWIVADISESDAGDVHVGTRASVWLPNRYKVVDAVVSNVLPQVDPVTRTVKVRVEVANTGHVLRPDMFVDVEISRDTRPGLMIASDAVIDSGSAKTVFVERSEGVFEPRRVQTGERVGETVQIVGGLEAGERIVVSGNFLLGSEARLKSTGDANTTSASRRVIDPSCGMEIDAAQAEATGHTAEYKQTTYHFCSEACKRKFTGAPEKYVHPSHDHHQAAASQIAHADPVMVARP